MRMTVHTLCLAVVSLAIPCGAMAGSFTCQQQIALSGHDVFVARVEQVAQDEPYISVELAVTETIQGDVPESLREVRWEADAELAAVESVLLVVAHLDPRGYVAGSCTRDASTENVRWARQQHELADGIKARARRRREFISSGMNVLDVDALVARSEVILVGVSDAPSFGSLRIEPLRRLLYDAPNGAGCAPRQVEWAEVVSNDRALHSLSHSGEPVIAFLRFDPDPAFRCHLELADPHFGLVEANDELERDVRAALSRR